MSTFVGLDRSKPPPKGELVKLWSAEIEKASAELRKKLTCPHCGFLMATGVPCGPAPEVKP